MLQVGGIVTAHLQATSAAHGLETGVYTWMGPLDVADNAEFGGRFRYAYSTAATLGQGLTALTDGVFQIACAYKLNTSTRMIARAVIDGTVVKAMWSSSNSAGNPSIGVMHTARLTAGQRLGVQVRQDSGSTQTRDSNQVSLTMTWLGQ